MFECISFLAETLYKFVDFMIASQHWSKTYENHLRIFDKYLYARYPNGSQLSQEMVDSWCAKRPSESNNTNLARTNVVVALIHYLQRRGLTDVKEPDRPKTLKCTHIPHAFTTEELSNFFYICDHIKALPNYKDDIIKKLIFCVIFRLMFCTGIRPLEARMLKRNEVDLLHGVLNIVQTKGHDQHYVAIHKSMIEILCEYDKQIDRLIPDRVYFFPKGSDGHWSKEWLREHFALFWQQANAFSHATLYDFRHHYATANINKWIDSGFDFYDKLYYLSKSMGHCNIEHTKYYYSIVPRMADILRDKSGSDFDDLVPEVSENEIW